MSDLVCLRTYLYRHEAELDQALLEAGGIRAMVSADDAGGMQPGMLFGSGGARLLVVEDQAEEALKLLEPPAQTD